MEKAALALAKVFSGISAIEEGSHATRSARQLRKAFPSMVHCAVSEGSMIIERRDVQFSKALAGIACVAAGMITDLSEEQPLKALAPIKLRDLGSVMVLIVAQP